MIASLGAVIAGLRPPSRRLRVEGALGSVGREMGGVGFGMVGTMRTIGVAARMLVRTGTEAEPRFSLPVSSTMPFRLIRSPRQISQ
mgnify:CR=1 FL=1